MIVVPCEQGSREWLDARLGIPTASQFHRILTPTGKPSSQADAYLFQLLAERLLREPIGDVGWLSGLMERGKTLEDEAVKWYEFDRDVRCDKVGFCLSDDRAIGCSADRLVGEHGGLEIKCPGPAQHLAYVLNEKSVDRDHWVQVQGCLLVTGRSWWDVVSYHPYLPAARVRVVVDPEYLDRLATALQDFCSRLDEAEEAVDALLVQNVRTVQQ